MKKEGHQNDAAGSVLVHNIINALWTWNEARIDAIMPTVSSLVLTYSPELLFKWLFIYEDIVGRLRFFVILDFDKCRGKVSLMLESIWFGLDLEA